MARRNEGIINQGTFQADTLAVGRNASVRIGSAAEVSPEKEQVTVALREFLSALETHAAKLEQAQDVKQVVEQLAEEADKARPNPLTLKGLLGSLKEAVISVAAMVPAFETLSVALMKLLGKA